MADFEAVGDDDDALLRRPSEGVRDKVKRLFQDKKTRWYLIGGILAVFLVILLIGVISLFREDKRNDNSGDAGSGSGGTVEEILGCAASSYPPWGNDTKVETTYLNSMRSEIRARFYPMLGGLGNFTYLIGGTTDYWTGTDSELPFHQETNFLYLTGVAEPEFQVILDHGGNTCALFTPRRDVSFAIWNGVIESLDEIKAKYGVDKVFYQDQLYDYVRNITQGINSTFFVLPWAEPEMNSTIFGSYQINNHTLLPTLYSARKIKTAKEIEMLTWSAQVSSQAHVRLMKEARAGLFEYNLASSFVGFCSNCDLSFQAYLPIVGSGEHSAILHWMDNTGTLQNGQILLVDAAGEFKGYCSDVTRTYPINGTFTEAQKIVYNMVLDVQTEVASLLKPGVTGTEVNNFTRDSILRVLLQNQFITGTLDQLRNASIQRLFMPHGVSHYLGLSVHDTDYLAANATLDIGNVITIEPGIYFIPGLLSPSVLTPEKRALINWAVVQPYLDSKFGGVRIEDDYVLVDGGLKIISTAPRTVEDIERVMANNSTVSSPKQLSKRDDLFYSLDGREQHTLPPHIE